MPSKRKKYNARFPPARIKKIMQTDEEVGKVAAAVPVIISRALEMFIESLISKSAENTRSRNARTLSTAHIKHTIELEKKFDFLKDFVANINITDVSQAEDDQDLNTSNNSLVSPEQGASGTAPGPRPRGRPRKRKPEESLPPKKRPRKVNFSKESVEESDSSDTEDAETESADSDEMENDEDEDTHSSDMKPEIDPCRAEVVLPNPQLEGLAASTRNSDSSNHQDTRLSVVSAAQSLPPVSLQASATTQGIATSFKGIFSSTSQKTETEDDDYDS